MTWALLLSHLNRTRPVPCGRSPDDRPRRHYRVAGKLGPMARYKHLQRKPYFLDVGLQGHPDYVEILLVRSEGDTLHYWTLDLEGGRTVERWCGTNVYERY